MAQVNDDESSNRLGNYLKNRRTKLDPASFGISGGRRRTAQSVSKHLFELLEYLVR